MYPCRFYSQTSILKRTYKVSSRKKWKNHLLNCIWWSKWKIEEVSFSLTFAPDITEKEIFNLEQITNTQEHYRFVQAIDFTLLNKWYKPVDDFLLANRFKFKSRIRRDDCWIKNIQIYLYRRLELTKTSHRISNWLIFNRSVTSDT